jgi:uncharacterized membrane protein
MNNKTNLLYFWIITASIMAACVPIVITFYIKSKKLIWLVISFILFLFLIYAYYKIFNNGDGLKLTSYYLTIKVLSILIIFLTSVIFFEEIFTYKKILGILLAILAIYLLQ